MSDDFVEVRAIFEEAVELPAGERATYLDRTCEGRPGLRRELDELLTAVDSSHGLEPASRADGLSALIQSLSAPEISGTRVGSYRLGRVLASGGMGVVFEAEQDEPRRAVALKMMRMGFDSPEGARRFRYEAEILGQLGHPGIAQVYETGVHRTEDGAGRERELPWFAMEFVERARTIVEFASEGRLSTEERLGLFLSVCDAVSHGHQRGVIHRDLKPDNILVDGNATPKVIDFGVARATDCDLAATRLFTRTGQVVGTLQYMAPEQTDSGGARVDERTDVYALGLVLFELLTGQHAYDFAGKGIHEIAEAVRNAPARRLASFDPGLVGDLQLIVDTAIDKDPERRYPSVAKLADDLRRFLGREPIAARPPSVAYQLRLFARRNRALVLSGAVVLAVSLVGAAVSIRWALRSEEAEQAARTEKAQATELLGLLLDDSLTSVLDFERRLAGKDDTAEMRRDLLRESVDRLVALEARAGDDPEVLLPLVRAYLRLGDLEGNPTVLNLGDLDAARRSIRRAHDLATRVALAHPDDVRVREVLGEATVSLASLAHADGDREGAVDHYRAAIRALQASATDDPLAVDMLVSRAYGHLAGVLAISGRLEEALSAAEARAEVTRLALGAAPDDPDRLGNHAASAAHLGIVLVQQQEYEPALAMFQEACEAHGRLYMRHGRGVDRYFFVKTRLMQVDPLWRLGRFDEAEALIDEELGELITLAESEPEIGNYTFHLGLAHLTFGDLFRQRAGAAADPAGAQDDLATARDHYTDAAAQFDRLFDAGRLVPEHRPMREHAHDSLRDCEAQLGR